MQKRSSTPNPRWTLAATILGSSMAFIDGTVVNVALPVLQSQLHATISDAQWIVNAYLLVVSSLILVGGALGDRFGLVRIYGIGVMLFACASIWCGLAPSLAQLIIARAIQGTGAALMIPGSLAIITAVFPHAQRGKAIGTWSALTAIAVIAGPPLGGVLVQTLSWRAVFFINIPLAVVVLWIIATRMRLLGGKGKGSIDWLGAILVTIGLALITWTLIEAPVYRRGVLTVVATAGLLCLTAFVIVESRAQQPLIPLTLFRSRSFSAANVLTLLLYAALSGVMFLLPFEWIHVQHYTAAEAGAAFLPIMCTMSILSPLSGRLAGRIGSRPFLIIGPVMCGAGFALLARHASHSYWTAYAPALFALGVGMGLTVAPLTTTVMTSIRERQHVGAGSGVNNAVARAAGLLATAVFGAVAAILFSVELDRRLAASHVSPQVRQAMTAQRLRLASATPPAGVDAQTRAAIEASIRAAFEKAFGIDMIAAAALAIASAAAGAIIRPTTAGDQRRNRESSPS